jgi:peptidoglycan/LPS O-acetylase OafA/YrhL
MVSSFAPAIAASSALAREKQSPEKIDSLTSLRFFACFFMVFYHANAHFFGSKAELNHDTFAPIVAFFFALSGFVITHNYSAIKDKRSILSFYLFRYARMLPIHILTALLFTIFLPALFRPSGPIFFSNLFLTQAWLPWSKFFFSYNSPSWSNSTEIFFYLCFPALLLAMRKAWYLPLLIGIIPAFATIAFCNATHMPHMSMTNPCVVGLIFVHPLSRIFEFTVGMIVALVFRERLNPLNLHPVKATILELTGLAWVLLAAFNSSAIRHDLMPILGDAGSLWVQSAGLPVLGCGLLIGALATEKGLIGRFLNWRLLVILGECSFAMYMLHSFFLTYASVNFPQCLSVNAYLLFWATLIVAGHFLTTVIDPLLRKLVVKAGISLINRATAFGGAEKKPNVAHKPLRPLISRIVLPVAEGLLLGFLCWSCLPALNRLDSKTASTMTETCAVRNVNFDPYLKCCGASAEKVVDGIRVRMVWESLKTARADYFVKASALNCKGEEIGCRTYSVSPRRETAEKGTLWSDEVTIGIPPDGSVSSATILVIRKHKMLAAATPNAVMTVPVPACIAAK